jgi:hypothetical protein
MSHMLRGQESSMDFELPHSGKEIICTVAQSPNMKDDSFLCTLHPVMFADSCRPATPDDFPDRGLVWWWWKASANQSRLTMAGKLVSVVIEPSRDQNPGKDHYQVRRSSAKELHEAGFYELLWAESTEFKSETDLISKSFPLSHVPASIVFVDWRSQILGPFRTSVVESSPDALLWNVSLSTQRTENKVQRIQISQSEAYRRLGWQILSVRYSRSGRVSGVPDLTQSSECTLLEKELLDKDFREADTFRIESDWELIRRVSTDVLSLSRKERKDFRDFLERLESRLSSNDSLDAPLTLKALERLREAEIVNNEAAAAIVDAVIGSGALSDTIDCRIEQRANEQSEKIQAIVEAQCGELRKTQVQLQGECNQRREELRTLEALFASELERRRREIEKQEEELREKEAAFLEVLLPVSDEIKSASSDLIQQALKFQLLFPQLAGQREVHAKAQAPASMTIARVEREGAGFQNALEFLQQRLHPMLQEWNAGLTEPEALNLFASFLGSRCILLPEIYAASVIAESIGTSLDLYYVEPDWLNFRSLWEGGLRCTWQDASSNPDQLFIVAVSGVNRTPSSAWAQPILTHAASISRKMPELAQAAWPDNLRVAFIWDPPNDVTFDLDRTFRMGCSAWRATSVNNDGQKLPTKEGFVSADAWMKWCIDAEVNGRDLALVSDEWDVSPTWRRGAISDVKRMAGALRCFGLDVAHAIRVAAFLRLETPKEAAGANEQ